MSMKRTQLLIDEPPMQLVPSLAILVGDREAIFLQQLHYWLGKATFHDEDGIPWVYNTYEQWHEQFPFWSLRTLRRIINKLEVEGLVDSTSEHNAMKIDQTKWYTIDYVELESQQDKMSSPLGHFDHP